MANEFKGQSSHSAEYFGDTRDFWWNEDFLALMARCLRFEDVRDILDVGCGVGHWGRALAPVLPAEARLIGIDRDPLWIGAAAFRAAKRGLGGRFDYLVAGADRLPFADGSFDLVTCQTVPIHMADPAAILGELARVARPGGLVLASEPNALGGALAYDATVMPINDVLGWCAFR